MSSFISALMKQRKDAKDKEPKSDGRLKEIIAVLKKYDYDDGLTPEITVSILQDLGPTFVKIGQIASQQAEYLPPEYCEAFSKLRSKVAPMDIETVYSQIEKHLGKPVDELFAKFYDKPLGGAGELTMKIFAPPATGENDLSAEDGMFNYYYTLEKMPEIRIRTAPTEPSKDR